jgi:hypothetical protein
MSEILPDRSTVTGGGSAAEVGVAAGATPGVEVGTGVGLGVTRSVRAGVGVDAGVCTGVGVTEALWQAISKRSGASRLMKSQPARVAICLLPRRMNIVFSSIR